MVASTATDHVSLRVRYPDGTVEGPVSATRFVRPSDIDALSPTTMLWGSASSGPVIKVFAGITGDRVSDLTSAPAFPHRPYYMMTRNGYVTLENMGDNFGVQLTGFFQPALSGEHRFHVMSDNGCELWLSADLDVNNKRLIASVSSYATSWDASSSQTSAPISLRAVSFAACMVPSGAR